MVIAHLERLRIFLRYRKATDGLAGSFPTREEFEKSAGIDCTEQEYELFMISLLDEGEVGMDGFKYCWPEVARENRARILAAGR